MPTSHMPDEAERSEGVNAGEYPRLRKIAVLRRNRVMGILTGRLPQVEDRLFEGLSVMAWNARASAIAARQAATRPATPQAPVAGAAA